MGFICKCTFIYVISFIFHFFLRGDAEYSGQASGAGVAYHEELN